MMKNKLKSYSFWIALISAVLMLIQAFGWKINIPVLREALIAVCGLFVMLGLINKPTKDNCDNEELYERDSEEKENKEK